MLPPWVIMGVIVLLRIFLNHRQQSLEVDQTAKMQQAFAKSITLTMELFSKIFFWYLFAMSAWWFVWWMCMPA